MTNELKGFEAWRAIDANPNTYWHTSVEEATPFPHELAVDLAETVSLTGFYYTPHQNPRSAVHGPNSGIIHQYSFYISNDGNNWEKVIDKGTFSNIRNNPVKQEVRFDQAHKARYIKLVSHATVNEGESWSSVAELGVLTR